MLDSHETRPPGKPMLMTEKRALEKTIYDENQKKKLQEALIKPSLTNFSDDLMNQDSSLDETVARVTVKNKSRRKVAEQLFEDALQQIKHVE